ncbi:MAG: AAA family ATPase [Terriglobales bacterium]
MATRITVLAESDAQQRHIEAQVQATGIAECACRRSFVQLAASGSLDELAAPETALFIVEITGEKNEQAFRAIELLSCEVPHKPIVAIGDYANPTVIIQAMRAGAREFLQRPVTSAALREAFRRLLPEDCARGKALAVVNAKGGSGATTVAVNLGVLLASGDKVLLVDLAVPGNSALHLNVRPQFTVADALENLDRLDACLLRSFVLPCHGGLDLLAGAEAPFPAGPEDMARLLDVLLLQYQYVVVDASSRLDPTIPVLAGASEKILLVLQPEIASIWNARKVCTYLGGPVNGKIQLVLNRQRNIPGFDEAELERTVGSRIVSRIPNCYQPVANSIEHGFPVVLNKTLPISQSFGNLASVVTGRPLVVNEVPSPVKRKMWAGLARLKPASAS